MIPESVRLTIQHTTDHVPDLTAHRPAWWDHARCIGDHTWFHLPTTERHAAIRQRKTTCAGCPERAQCAQVALDSWPLTHAGVWAGVYIPKRGLWQHRNTLRAIATGNEPTPPTQRPQCGSEAGYKTHRRLNETTCDACRTAHNASAIAANRRYRAKLREQRQMQAG